MGAECGMHGRATRDAYSVLMVKPEGKIPFGSRTYQWDDITMNLTEIGWDSMHLVQNRAKWWAIVMYNEPSQCIKYG